MIITNNDVLLAVSCCVMSSLLSQFDLILGMEVINRLGGLKLNTSNVSLHFRLASCREEIQLVVEDVDLEARFDGTKWIHWKCTNGEMLQST